MKKDLQISNVIDFESAKKTYLAKVGKSDNKVKPAQKKKKEDPFDWERIRNIKVKIVCKDKH